MLIAVTNDGRYQGWKEFHSTLTGPCSTSAHPSIVVTISAVQGGPASDCQTNIEPRTISVPRGTITMCLSSGMSRTTSRGCRGRLKPRHLQQNRPLGEPLREDAFLMFPQLRYTKGHEKVRVRRSFKGMMMIGQTEGLSASR